MKRRNAGKESAGPGRATVGRGGKADVSSSATEDPPDLECADDGGTEGEGIGLHFGGVLAAAVGESVGT